MMMIIDHKLPDGAGIILWDESCKLIKYLKEKRDMLACYKWWDVRCYVPLHIVITIIDYVSPPKVMRGVYEPYWRQWPKYERKIRNYQKSDFYDFTLFTNTFWMKQDTTVNKFLMWSKYLQFKDWTTKAVYRKRQGLVIDCKFSACCTKKRCWRQQTDTRNLF